MPFMKKRMEEDEPPAERVERNDRMVREVREEPEYTETAEMEPEPARHKAPQQKPTSLTVKISFDEMRHDIAAHISVINATSLALERTGMPSHVAQQLTQSLCAANIQRARDIEAVLKQYGN